MNFVDREGELSEILYGEEVLFVFFVVSNKHAKSEETKAVGWLLPVSITFQCVPVIQPTFFLLFLLLRCQ